MTILSLLALAPALAGAVDAPVTAVTVFSDRARVVRTATVKLDGTKRLELPALPETVDAASIRVEAAGATIERVEITRLEADELPIDEARTLVGELERADDAIARVRGERDAAQALLDLAARLAPTAPPGEPQRPPPHMSPTGWPAVLAFLDAWEDKLQGRVREGDRRLTELGRGRDRLVERARILGGAGRRAGWRVVAQVEGHGDARVTLSYLAAQARWYPSYDLQLLAGMQRVELSLVALVSQETGEDWVDAAITASTAVPATATEVPLLPTWAIGERERFIPTPVPAPEIDRPPPETPTALPAGTSEAELLRAALAARLESQPEEVRIRDLEQRVEALKEQVLRSKARAGLLRETVLAGRIAGDGDQDEKKKGKKEGKEDGRATNRIVYTEDTREAEESAGETVAVRRTASFHTMLPGAAADATSITFNGATSPQSEVVASEGVALAPPPGYRPPTYAPDLPVSLAGGWDVAFEARRAETVRSGKGARRVALVAETWPVTVERKLYPALNPEAYLVAEIRNPSKRALPGGNANLFVGADPAGVARLKLVAPGEAFTLPLGLDRAIRPLRNVKLSTTEKGLFSKDELTEYVVTIEIANPYAAPIAARVIDQWPLSDAKDVETRLLGTSPQATQDDDTHALEWRLTLPPSGKTTVTFTYTVRRPRGWRLHQR